MSGQLCLKWNNHNNAFNKLLNTIYLEDVYSDGTILCQGRFFPVHRFVLSTCSEYFEKMFSQCFQLNNKHPFIIVKDIHPDQMEALLNYMYKGEVNVPQEMLPELIKAAEAFKVKGLAVCDEDLSSMNSRKRLNPSSPPPVAKRSRRFEENKSDNRKNDKDEPDTHEDNWDTSHNPVPSTSNHSRAEEILTRPNEHNSPSKIKTEPLDVSVEHPISDKTLEVPGIESVKPEEEYETFSGDDSNFETFDCDTQQDGLDGQEQELPSWDNSQTFDGDEDPTHRIQEVDFPTLHTFDDQQQIFRLKSNCSFPGCSYQSFRPDYIKKHFKIHSGDKPFKCPQCYFRSGRKTSLTRHVKSVHGTENPFTCQHCSFQTARKDKLKLHMVSKHREEYNKQQSRK